MAKQAQTKTFVTEIPLTAEARERYIEELFADYLPHIGELCIPNDSLYVHGTWQHRAKHITNELCVWLGIKPGYIGLEFEGINESTTDGKHYTIFVEQSLEQDEFLLAAFLAQSLTRYLLEEKKQIHLPNHDQQTALLASATVVFGLGIVVLNGAPRTLFKQSSLLIIQNFPRQNYVYMVRAFIRKHLIDIKTFDYTLSPKVAKELGLKSSKKPIHAVRELRHDMTARKIKTIGLIWVLCMVIGIASFALLTRLHKPNPMIQETQKNIALLEELQTLCADTLHYDQQYTDASDIQAMRSLRAEELRCKSLGNQLDATKQKLNQLNRN